MTEVIPANSHSKSLVFTKSYLHGMFLKRANFIQIVMVANITHVPKLEVEDGLQHHINRLRMARKCLQHSAVPLCSTAIVASSIVFGSNCCKNLDLSWSHCKDGPRESHERCHKMVGS